jgi:alcohol dehydrogenase YqhD (iron-dependent ADH family)
MQDYNYFVPTRLVFGKGKIEELPKYISNHGKKVLLTYGGGSIKRNGLYDRIKQLLKDYEVFELSGIEPNPKITSVRKGVEIVKQEKIDLSKIVKYAHQLSTRGDGILKTILEVIL